MLTKEEHGTRYEERLEGEHEPERDLNEVREECCVMQKVLLAAGIEAHEVHSRVQHLTLKEKHLPWNTERGEAEKGITTGVYRVLCDACNCHC